jgi:ribosomal protein S18 acetylase RimI-like enzyme
VIAVRAVRAGEGELLRELRLRALADAPAAFASTVEQEQALPESHWSELADRSDLSDAAAIFVAIDDGRWVGMGAGRWDDRDRGIAHLWSMWVDPGSRGARIGERLVDQVARWAAEQGGSFLRLGVITRPGDATGFYERIGFVRTGEEGPLRRDPARSVHFLARPV